MSKIGQLLYNFLSIVVSKKDKNLRAIWKLVLWLELLVGLITMWDKSPWKPDLLGLPYALIALSSSLFMFMIIEGRRFQAFGLSISPGWLKELGLGLLIGAAGIILYTGVYLPGTFPLFKYNYASKLTLYEKEELTNATISVEFIVVFITGADTDSIAVTLSNESHTEQQVTVLVTYSWRGWFKRTMQVREAKGKLEPASRKAITIPVEFRSALVNTKVRAIVKYSESDDLLFQKSFQLRNLVR